MTEEGEEKTKLTSAHHKHMQQKDFRDSVKMFR